MDITLHSIQKIKLSHDLVHKVGSGDFIKSTCLAPFSISVSIIRSKALRFVANQRPWISLVNNFAHAHKPAPA